ncbi:putative diguanylate cyclase YedQ [Raoultella planticola]|uniref:Putative diguanylate cyclase YedQ n=1 Tax=Raoultella planticola TaxID=575 RepID=A0A485ACM2_RAOPL|nr:putative diguanylate cyclase YedQ [Raoultella planticola]
MSARKNDDSVVTASIPLDFRHDWLGVLSMDFSVREMKAFLVSAIKGGQEGEYQLYDSRVEPDSFLSVGECIEPVVLP